MIRLAAATCGILFFALALLPAESNGQERPLNFANTSKYVSSGRYDWTVYVDADGATLNAISSVEYTLDPSFPNPVRRITSRGNRFSLSANGWGEFTIYIKVLFTDGKEGSYRYHLSLSKTTHGKRTIASVKPPPHVASSPRAFDATKAVLHTANTSTPVGDRRWDWKVYIEADDAVLDQIRSVEYTLHPTFPQPIRQVSDRGSEHGRGFFLSGRGWGTFQIAVKVVFNDGTTRFLKHDLRFGS
jgi:transcription initiation factor IIF auxiliary subunit